MTYQNESGRYDNVVKDVIGSGILATLTPRRQTILLMLAGMAMRDSASYRHRTAFAYQENWADKLGIHRTTANKNFKAMEAAGVIAMVGKHKGPKGGQNANVYRIPDFDGLCELADARGKEKRAERVQSKNLRKGKGVASVGHLSDEKVSRLSDSKVSRLSDTLPEKVSRLSDTEVVSDLELVNGKGNSVFQDLKLGITENGNEPETARAGAPTATPDGVIQESGEGVSESVKPSRTTGQWIDELRVVATGERERTIRLAIQDHGGYINGERVPITVDAGVAFLENRFEQMGMVQ